MKQIMSDWKRFLATKLNIEWQRDFFDHRLRKAESYREKADYIRANPVRAGLVKAPQDWPYFWQADPQQQNTIGAGGALRGGAPGGRALPLLVIALLFASCLPDMMNQPKAKPLSESDFFSNQANARPIPPHSIEHGDARGLLEAAELLGHRRGRVTQRVRGRGDRRAVRHLAQHPQLLQAHLHARTSGGTLTNASR